MIGHSKHIHSLPLVIIVEFQLPVMLLFGHRSWKITMGSVFLEFPDASEGWGHRW